MTHNRSNIKASRPRPRPRLGLFVFLSLVISRRGMCFRYFIYWCVFIASLHNLTSSTMSMATDEITFPKNNNHDNKGGDMLIDQSRVAYGGILNEFALDVKTSDSDVTTVIEFAMQYAEQSHPSTVLKDENGKIVKPTISNLQKLRLQATRDGKSQYHLVETTVVGDKEQFQRRKLIYGLTYSFSLMWRQVGRSSYIHFFVVSLDRQRNMYVFEHTFNQDGEVASPPSSDEFAQESVGGKNVIIASKTAIPIATVEPTFSSSQSECLQSSDGTTVDQSQCEKSTENFWKFKWKTDSAGVGVDSEPTCTCSVTETKRLKLHGEIKIVTQNIWNFNGISGDKPSDKDEAYVQRMSRLGGLMAKTKADIIGLQEVRFDVNGGSYLGPCQVQQLTKFLPKHQFVYQPAVNYVPDSFDRTEEGLAIFSLHPILSHDFILLSRDMNDEEDKPHQRICLHAEIQTPSLGRLHIFLTHLSLSQSARERSVVEIWNHMSKFPGPAVLIGDLNAEPTSRVVRFLQGEVEINGVKTRGMKDAWLMMNKEPRIGVYAKDEPRDLGLTFSTLDQHLSERIDYIFTQLPDTMQMSNVSVVDDGGRGHGAASDHLGLQVTIVSN